MKLQVLAVGDRTPRWVDEACADYQQRFPPHCPLYIDAVPAPRRGRNPDIPRLKDKEHNALAARTPADARRVALDAGGEMLSTDGLARRLDTWMHSEKAVVFLIGGPDGLAPAVLRGAQETWSLSALTLPHALVRVIVAEQLYRALCVLSDHPYHSGH